MHFVNVSRFFFFNPLLFLICRQEMASLKHQHRRDVSTLQEMLRGEKPPETPRNGKQEPQLKPLDNFQPIGYVSTPFPDKNGTPRQGSLCPGASAVLKLNVPNASDMLRGLEEFSHVWLVFLFHKNSPKCGAKATVAPPRLDGRRLGVFATRAPYRPNPIGLTLARIHSITG